MSDTTQLLTYGTIIGYVKDTQDMVIVSDGLFQVLAYVPYHIQQPRIGNSYTLVRINNTYHLGSEIDIG